jgi:flavin reductase (DIM6/NTAB) family NADH-FMN oxidoreductase RutF
MTSNRPDPDAYRRVIGHFGSGVTIITSVAPEGPVGFTASSVASLSLDPLLVMVGVSEGSETLSAIRGSGAFGVNILERNQVGLARRFASSDREGRFVDLSLAGAATGSPLVRGSLAWLDCRLHAEVPAGDHLVVIGRVEACEAFDGEPLLYYRGAFGGWAS